VIIFTDMFGGTPSNISLSFLERDQVEIVTGVNLPMIIKFGAERRRQTCRIAHMIREKGSKSIRVASDLLAGENAAGGDVMITEGDRDHQQAGTSRARGREARPHGGPIQVGDQAPQGESRKSTPRAFSGILLLARRARARPDHGDGVTARRGRSRDSIEQL
jgi:hypothetical protein